MHKERPYTGVVEGAQSSEVGEERAGLIRAVIVLPGSELHVLQRPWFEADRVATTLDTPTHIHRGESIF